MNGKRAKQLRKAAKATVDHAVQRSQSSWMVDQATTDKANQMIKQIYKGSKKLYMAQK